MQSLEDWNSYTQIQQTGLQGWGNRLQNEWLASKAGPIAGQRVLEIGGSSGEHLAFLQARHSPYPSPGSYTILDPEAKMTNPELAEALEQEVGVNFVQGVAEEIPFASSMFDLVMSTCVFAHMDDPERAMREVARVLRPEGRFLIVMPTDPGFLNSTVKKFVTFPKMRRLGIKNPRLEYARSHRNPVGNLLAFAHYVFKDFNLKKSFVPFGVPVSGANLFVGLSGLSPARRTAEMEAPC